MHNAGNDVAFTLRSFLALATKTQRYEREYWLSLFQQAAIAPVNVTELFAEMLVREIAAGRAKKLQGRQNKQKHWDDMLEIQLAWKCESEGS